MTETAASDAGSRYRPLIVVPASPALVLSRDADPAGVHLRAAVERTLSRHRNLPVHLVGSRDPRWRTGHRGSFAGWGDATVNVGEGHHLPELVQRFLLGPAGAERIVDVRGKLGEPAHGVLTLVALDGSAGLTGRAPLALIDGADSVDAWCRALLAGNRPPGKNPDSLRTAGVLEPDLWLELAGIRPARAELIAADVTSGVGRYVAEWEVGV